MMRRILAMVFGVLVVVGVLGVLPALANAAEQNVLSIPGAANTMVLSDLGKKTAAVYNFVSDGSSFTKALLWKSAKGKFDARRAKVTAGDFDHDGLSDLVVLWNTGKGRCTLKVLKWTGTAFKWISVWTSPKGSLDWASARMSVGDPAATGADSVLVMSRLGSGATVIYMLSAAAPQWRATRLLTAVGSAVAPGSALTCGDVDADLQDEAVVLSPEAGGTTRAVVYQYDQTSKLLVAAQIWSGALALDPDQVACGDFNGDGGEEVVCLAAGGGSSLTLLKAGDADVTSSVVSLPGSIGSPARLRCADVTGTATSSAVVFSARGAGSAMSVCTWKAGSASLTTFWSEATPALGLSRARFACGPTDPVAVKNGVKVLTPAVSALLSDVSADGSVLTFASTAQELTSLKAGDTVVVQASGEADNGALRQVVSVKVSGGKTVLTTAQASMDDVFSSAEMFVTGTSTDGAPPRLKARMPNVKIGQPQRVRVVVSPGTRPVSGPRTCPSTTGGRQWQWKYPISVDLGDAGKLTGHFTLSETHEYWVKVKWHWFMKFSVKAKLLETLSEDFSLTHKIDISDSFHYEEKIASISMGRITFAIGPVPVWLTPSLDLSVFVDASGKARLVTSVSQNCSLSIGCEYDNGFKNLCGFSSTYSFQKPELTLKCDAKAGLKLKVGLDLYDCVGVYADAEPFLKFHANIADNPWWYLHIGVDAGIGVHGKILGHDLGDQEWQLGEIWGMDLAHAKGPFAADKSPPTTTVTGAGDTWHNKPVTLTFKADDGDGSGVKSTTYHMDGGSWTVGNSLVVPAPANTSIDHVVEYYSTDEAGNIEKTKTCHVKIDTIAPICTVAGADDAWHVTPVILKFTGMDNAGGSGIATTQSSLDGGAWADGATLTINTPKVHHVQYRAVDKAGNVSVPGTCTVKWGGDSTPPTTTQTGADDLWHNHAVTVTFSAVDNPGGYGVDITEYRVDTGAWTKGTSVTLSTNGDHTLSYRSTDVVGNVEDARVCHVKLDFDAPLTSLRPSGEPVTDPVTGLKKYGGVNVSFDLAGSDSLSGVDYTEFKLDTVTAAGTTAGAWTRGTRVPAGDGGLAAGHYVLSYRSADKAGNVETVKSAEFLVTSNDIIAPTTSGSWNVTFTFGGDLPYWWSGWEYGAPPIMIPTFAMTSSDNVGGSGVAYIEYKFDEMKNQSPYTTIVAAGTWTKGTAAESPPAVNFDAGRSESVFRLSYRSVDAAGNVETAHTFTYRYVFYSGI